MAQHFLASVSLLILFGVSSGAVADDTSDHKVTLKGRVVDADDQPVAAARIYLAISDSWYATTHGYGKAQETPRLLGAIDSSGEFSVEVLSLEASSVFASSSLIALGPDASNFCVDWGDAYLFNTSNKKNAANDPTDAKRWKEMRTLTLTPENTPISGRLVDEKNSPVVGARVRVANIQQLREGGLKDYVNFAMRDNPRDYDDARNHNVTKSFFGEQGRLSGFGDILSATTDSNGRFTLRGIGQNRIAWLIVDGSEIATERLLVRSESGNILQMKDGDAIFRFYSADFEHTVQPSASIVGTVTDQDSGKPVPGVIIENLFVFPTFKQGECSATTDHNGRYRLTGLPLSEVRMLASSQKAPYLPSRQNLDLRKNPTSPFTFDWKLKRGLWIEGRVFNSQTKRPIISELHYFAFQDNPNVSDLIGFRGSLSYPNAPPFCTDADGRYRIPGLSGRGLVAVKAIRDFDGNHYLTNKGQEQIAGAKGSGMWTTFDVLPAECRVSQYHGIQEVNPQQGELSAVHDFSLAPSETLTGRVLLPDGKPLAGYIYSGLYERSFFMSPNAQQSEVFQVRDYDPTFPRRLIFRHEERKLAGTIVLTGEKKGGIEVQLEPEGTFTGTVVDNDGSPLAGIVLEVAPLIAPKLPTTIGALPKANYKTDKNGEFRIDGVAPGMKYNLVTQTPQGGLKQVVFDAVAESGVTTDLGKDLKLLPFKP